MHISPKFSVYNNFSKNFSTITLARDTNQARGIADYAINFMKQDSKKIDDKVYERVSLFHTDSVYCGLSALALRTNAPNILRDEAI